MRTTLVLDDKLYKRAKERAVALNTTVSEVVNQAIREVLSKPLPRSTKFEMVTFGDATVQGMHEPSDFADALANEDAALLGR